MRLLAFIVALLLAPPSFAAQARYSKTSGAPYTSFSCTFRVPAAVLPPGQTVAGVGVWCGTGDTAGPDLIQLGTHSCAQTPGNTLCFLQPTYGWYEIYPVAAETSLSQNDFPVKPGDIVTASGTCTLPCPPSTSQSWTLKLVNVTQGGATFTTVQAADGSLNDVTLATEAPFTVGPTELPTVNFGKILWLQATGNGTVINFTGSSGSNYTGCCGQTVSTSLLTSDGHGFANCFGLTPTFTTCPAPTNGLAFDAGKPTLGKF